MEQQSICIHPKDATLIFHVDKDFLGFNPFQTNFHFFFSLKKSENQTFSNVSKEDKKEIKVWNGQFHLQKPENLLVDSGNICIFHGKIPVIAT